ncbi:16881_t:CDS:2, partial [Dentiscutata erythropus]
MENNNVSREAHRKRKSKESETSQQREARLARERERKRQKKMQETSEEREVHMSRERDRKQNEREMETNEQYEERLNYQRHFREQIKQQNLSRIIEELDPIIDTQGNCKLKGLTKIEEMLIAQVFPVMSVYRLRGGQLGYRGNVINFLQDVREFTTRLPRHPSSLDILIVCRQSGDLTSFRDFNVRRAKISRALYWLKANN